MRDEAGSHIYIFYLLPYHIALRHDERVIEMAVKVWIAKEAQKIFVRGFCWTR
jgi:hypothetical protein